MKVIKILSIATICFASYLLNLKSEYHLEDPIEKPTAVNTLSYDYNLNCYNTYNATKPTVKSTINNHKEPKKKRTRQYTKVHNDTYYIVQ